MKRLTISVLLYVLCIVSLAFAEEPILVIDSQEHSEKISDVMFTPDGKTLVSVSEDKTIRVWDVETAELINTIRGQIGSGHDGKLFAGALSPDGKTLATGSTDATVKLWSFPDAQVLHTLQDRKKVVAAVQISPDGKWVAAG